MQNEISAEPTISQSFKAVGEALRELANLVDALALANEGGADCDLLKTTDVMRLLNCKQSKACQIIRAHGIGGGKMRRIERGKLIQLQREGRI